MVKGFKHITHGKWLVAFLAFAFALFGFLAVGEDARATLPQEDDWAGSGHADTLAEAFTHWDEDDPPEIGTSCAKCHSTEGMLDFLGEDDPPTDFGVVDNPVPVPTDPPNAIYCEACHNDTASSLDSVTFPSGVEVTGLGPEARCMLCHQGRASKGTVDDEIADAAPPDDDTVDTDLGFINIHYYAAAATLHGTVVMGGYEYDGKTYDARLNHVEGYRTCVDCHNPHSLEVRIDECVMCHTNVVTEADLLDIRTNGSLVDYDGDGDILEGVYYEVVGLQEKLYEAIQAYGAEVAGTYIIYDSHSYPYFFIDTNENGEVDPGENIFPNMYNAWTARLLKAAYNYQVSQKDPGAFAHGGKYVIELLYDSIEDLNSVLALPAGPVDLTGTSRVDEGHFDGSSEAWRHWDEDGEVRDSCARCHSGEGLAFLLEHGVNIAAETANGMYCANCHDDITTEFTRLEAGEVTFPSELTADLDSDSNLCMNCHQGRNSKKQVDDTIESSPGPYGFLNIHYYPAAASLMGTEVQGGYEVDRKTYSGQGLVGHPFGGGMYDTCVECHMADSHNVVPDPAGACNMCHGTATLGFKGFRAPGTIDYDGDSNMSESSRSEIQGLEEALFPEIQTYAAGMGHPIAYDSHTYPYFVNDLNGNGVADPDETNRGNRYQEFDADLLKAAYNYHTSIKEPCGYIHNADYIAELLVDSIELLTGDISGYPWRDPLAPPPSCGNGRIDWKLGETCEPPNSPIGGNWFCDNNCQAYYAGTCGDGVVQWASGEECEIGVGNECGPGKDCVNCMCVAPETLCGNGVVNWGAGEECEIGVGNECGPVKECVDCVCVAP